MPQPRLEAQLSDTQTDSPTERDQPLVLVVDDTPVHRKLAAEVLEHCGFVIEEAVDGAEGLEKARALRPDLIILDVMMPNVDGFTACGELREDSETAHIPVLMVTALNDMASIERAFDVGATDFMIKPISPSLLQYRVKYMMKAYRTERQLREAKRQAEDAFETVAMLSRALEEQVQDRTAQLAATQGELLEKERQLRQAQKMDALGQLAGGVAHEFNNQLTVIGGFGRAALQKVDNVDRVRECLEEIVAASDRSAALTSQMLTFSRSQVMSASVVDVDTVIANMKKVLQSAVGATIELRIELDESEVAARVDSNLLSQAILNLAVNARDAMPTGGILTIGTKRVALSSSDRLSHYPAPVVAGHYVRVFVEDTGAGIERATMDRIFDPFFTTKDVGKGTGLGLSVVFGIVNQCNGMIDVISAPGKGTAISIYLPVNEKIADEEKPIAEVPSFGKGEIILVADDERSVLNLVKITLEDLGYQVLSACSGIEAIEILEKHANDIDLLLTDIMMPKMGGLDLANKFSGMCPEKSIVYMSGYSLELNAHREHLGDDCNFIGKPFNPADLATMVRMALDT